MPRSCFLAVFSLLIIPYSLVAATLAPALDAPVIPRGSVMAVAASQYHSTLTSINLTIDQSGLVGDLHDNHQFGHTMWLSVEGGGGSAQNHPLRLPCSTWIQYTFDALYQLDSLWIWNHNQQNLTDRGLRHVAIHYSPDGLNWLKLGDFELTRAPGTSGYSPGDIIPLFSAEAISVLITAAPADGNYGSAYYGLSEVRFHGTPRPFSFPTEYPVRFGSIQVDPVYDSLLTPQPVGWLGSDVARSIPLSPTRSLWLFGDTFIGTSTAVQRNPGAAFVTSSIALQDRSEPPPGQVEFFWGPGNSAFFPHQPGTPGSFYWASQGIFLEGNLFIFCYSVSWGGGPLGFTIDGSSMIRIRNPQDAPAQWVQEAYDLGLGDRIFHGAVFVEDPYVYFMGPAAGLPEWVEEARGAMALARIRIDTLLAGGLGESFEFWTEHPEGSQWSDSPENLVPLLEMGVSETDIQYDSEWQLYFMTLYNAFSPVIHITTAPALTGPWSPPQLIYMVPEHFMHDFPLISYAVRPHPELSTQPGELILTYNTNPLGTTAPLFTPEGYHLYHPRFLRLQLEPPSNAAGEQWMLLE